MWHGSVRTFLEKKIMKKRSEDVCPSTMKFVMSNAFPDRSVAPKLETGLNRFGAYKKIMGHREASTLALNVRFPYRESLKEAISLDSHFVEHRKDYNFGWFAVCLHGTTPEQTNDYYVYGFKSREQANYQWTELAHKAPVTLSWLKDVWPYDEFFRVRFVKLEPGGYITPHNDTDGERGYFAVNICLNQPVGCVMVMENYGIVPWAPGDVRLMDIGLRHSVVNLSHKNRYHIIIHGRAHSTDARKKLHDFIVKNI